jgi:ankyrin
MSRAPLACILFLSLCAACYSTAPTGADIQPWSRGAQPLHYAVFNGDADSVELLLEHGADVNAIAGNGWTPLHIACASGREALVDLLLENGADVNAMTEAGDSPLVLATRYGDADIVEDLLSHGASIVR